MKENKKEEMPEKINEKTENMEESKKVEKPDGIDEKKRTIKIPKDPLNKGDLSVPVGVNGYVYNIKRGESVEVPQVVAEILEEAGYI